MDKARRPHVGGRGPWNGRAFLIGCSNLRPCDIHRASEASTVAQNQHMSQPQQPSSHGGAGRP
jgi:hypothetical protein